MPAEWLEKTSWLSGLVRGASVMYILVWFVGAGGLNLNIVILIFLIAGVILHVTPGSYPDSLRESVGANAGIILQFPFYPGVIGMMGKSDLIEVIASWFNAISTPETLPFWAFISGGSWTSSPLPALGIAGLKAWDVMGYCVMALIVSGVIIMVELLLLT